jgi:hypothetical protein
MQTGMERLNIVKEFKYLPNIGDQVLSLRLAPVPNEGTKIEAAGKYQSELFLCFFDAIVFRYAATSEPHDQLGQINLTAAFVGAELDGDVAESWSASGSLPTAQKAGMRVVYPIDYGSVESRLNGIESEGLGEIAMIEDQLKILKKDGEKNKAEKTKIQELETRKIELKAEATYLRRLKTKWQGISKYRVDWIVLAKLGNHQVPLAWSIDDKSSGN